MHEFGAWSVKLYALPATHSTNKRYMAAVGLKLRDFGSICAMEYSLHITRSRPHFQLLKDNLVNEKGEDYYLVQILYIWKWFCVFVRDFLMNSSTEIDGTLVTVKGLGV